MATNGAVTLVVGTVLVSLLYLLASATTNRYPAFDSVTSLCISLATKSSGSLERNTCIYFWCSEKADVYSKIYSWGRSCRCPWPDVASKSFVSPHRAFSVCLDVRILLDSEFCIIFPVDKFLEQKLAGPRLLELSAIAPSYSRLYSEHRCQQFVRCSKSIHHLAVIP